jgi:hypothetical protein
MSKSLAAWNGTRGLALIGLAATLASCESLTASEELEADTDEPPPVYTSVSVPAGARLATGTLSRMSMALPASHRPLAFSLLERTPGPWSVDMSRTYGAPPKPSNIFSMNCQSDYQVGAAIVLSWGAEAYARANDAAGVREAIGEARAALRNAWQLCDKRTMSRANCSTARVIECDDLQQYSGA